MKVNLREDDTSVSNKYPSLTNIGTHVKVNQPALKRSVATLEIDLFYYSLFVVYHHLVNFFHMSHAGFINLLKLNDIFTMITV